MRKAKEGLDRTRAYLLAEAVSALKANATVKFDETIEIAMNLGVDPKHADQNVRGAVTLPHGTGNRCASRSSPRATRRMKQNRPAPMWSARKIWRQR